MSSTRQEEGDGGHGPCRICSVDFAMVSIAPREPGSGHAARRLVHALAAAERSEDKCVHAVDVQFSPGRSSILKPTFSSSAKSKAVSRAELAELQSCIRVSGGFVTLTGQWSCACTVMENCGSVLGAN